MDKKQRRLIIWAVLGFVVCGMVLWGVLAWLTLTSMNQWKTAFQVQQSPLEARLDAMRLRQADFPSTNWHAYAPTDEQSDALIARSYEYNHNDAFWIKVNQQLEIYPDAPTAQIAFAQASLKWYSPAWQPLPDLKFADHTDMMNLRCIEGYVNSNHHYSCIMISTYGDTMMFVLANIFDDQWFTMTDFEQLLTALDQRMVDAMETAEP